MNFALFFYSTVSSASLISAALWLCRSWIATRLKAAVEHEFNAKLASIQSAQRKSEEELKAELRQKELSIQALQSGALSALASRQSAKDKRRMEAVDQLWAAMQSLAPALAVVHATSFLKYEACMKEAASNQKFRTVIPAQGNAGHQAIVNDSAWIARPHITKIAWAFYAAYRAILGFYVVRNAQLQMGVDKDFTDHDAVKKLVLAALPHQAEHLAQVGVDGLHVHLPELEQRLLDEISAMLSGKDGDMAAVEQARAILVAAQATVISNEKAEAEAKNLIQSQ